MSSSIFDQVLQAHCTKNWRQFRELLSSEENRTAVVLAANDKPPLASLVQKVLQEGSISPHCRSISLNQWATNGWVDVIRTFTLRNPLSLKEQQNALQAAEKADQVGVIRLLRLPNAGSSRLRPKGLAQAMKREKKSSAMAICEKGKEVMVTSDDSTQIEKEAKQLVHLAGTGDFTEFVALAKKMRFDQNLDLAEKALCEAASFGANTPHGPIKTDIEGVSIWTSGRPWENKQHVQIVQWVLANANISERGCLHALQKACILENRATLEPMIRLLFAHLLSEESQTSARCHALRAIAGAHNILLLQFLLQDFHPSYQQFESVLLSAVLADDPEMLNEVLNRSCSDTWQPDAALFARLLWEAAKHRCPAVLPTLVQKISSHDRAYVNALQAALIPFSTVVYNVDAAQKRITHLQKYFIIGAICTQEEIEERIKDVHREIDFNQNLIHLWEPVIAQLVSPISHQLYGEIVRWAIPSCCSSVTLSLLKDSKKVLSEEDRLEARKLATRHQLTEVQRYLEQTYPPLEFGLDGLSS